MTTNSKGYMPRQDGAFIAWAKTIYRDCAENAPAWQLDPIFLNQFGMLLADAETKYNTNSDEELRNRATVKAKNGAFAALKQFLAMYINTLEGNPNIPDEMIESMGLRPRHPHAHEPIPVPTETPVLTAIVGQHHDVTLYVSTLQHGRPTQFLKDGKFAGFLLKYKIDGDTQWESVISTQLHYTLIFTDEDEGKHILLQAAWVNPRMQNGPWSEEVRELIN
ncbi:MAG: hypothetical protein LBJ67_09875 [Planctomycetaceae bacterium]|jgi:hypothetical protein|nr:hypothetical protein [Planctomycetaceae bacterium]